MARRWLWLAVLTMACASSVSPPPGVAREIRLTVYPSFALAGGAVWITCYVPREIGAGMIRYGLEGVRMSGPEAMTRIEHRILIEHLECGDWIASCTVATAARVSRYESPLVVRGGICDTTTAS